MQLKIGFYSKQMIFFILLILISGILYYLIANNYIFGSIGEVLDLSTSRGTYTLPINIKPNSSVQIANITKNNLIEPYENFDLFKYVVYSQEGIYANQVQTIVSLPKPISSINELKPKIYAVHGVGSTNYYLQNPSTIVFEAYNLSPSATFTIEMEFPKNYLNIPLSKQIIYNIKNLSIYYWILIALIPLLITFVILFYLFRKTSKEWLIAKNNLTLELPPSNLSPAAAGLLINNKISSNLIAATLLDLARIGKIKIVDHGEYFTFYKISNSAEDLKNFEKILLNKIFGEKNISSSMEDIEMRIAKHIFSKKIAQVYLDIYEEVKNKEYFIKNPTSYQNFYKKLGYSLFFIGLIGFIFSMIYISYIPYVLIIWFSIIISSIFIINISPKLPARTEKGFEETKKWFAFKNFLTLKKPFAYSYESQNVYEKYLPYAVAFGIEKQWTKRFSKTPFKLPQWLETNKNTLLIEDMLNEIVPFVEFVSSKLTQIKEPIV